MNPPHDSSNTWGPLPGWLAASTPTTGSFPAVPQTRRRPRSRPTTLRGVSPTDMPSMASMGTVRRGSPPPDIMRIASQFALLGTLLLALVLSWALGG